MKPIKIAANGSSATTGASSATIAIPNDSSGVTAKTVLISVQGATYVLPGASGATATTASTIVTPEAPLLLDVTGHTHIAHIQLTAAQAIVVTPVES